MKRIYVLSAILLVCIIYSVLALKLYGAGIFQVEGRNASIWSNFSQQNRHRGWLILTCESGLKNICEPDTDGILSCGISQIHLDGTWSDLENKSGIKGSFLDPFVATKMLNWAMDHGEEYRWTCSRLTSAL